MSLDGTVVPFKNTGAVKRADDTPAVPLDQPAMSLDGKTVVPFANSQ